jgi:hypothetical protein
MNASHRWQCHSVGLNSGLLAIFSVPISGKQTPIRRIQELLALNVRDFRSAA